MKILIDDLSITWKYDNFGNLFEQLGLTDVVTQPIRTKYYEYGEYFDGVLIAYNKDSDGVVTDTFLDISGKGCRTIEQLNNLDFDWRRFLMQYSVDFMNRQANITRIDIACDLEDEEVSFDKFRKYAENELYICKSKVLPRIIYKREECIYFGSEKSNRLLRIYNKALEQNLDNIYWIRLEFQLRNECAMSWFLNWQKESDVGKLWRGVMVDYLRFVAPPKGADIDEIRKNKHQGRLQTATWWKEILGETERIGQLYLPGEEYTLERLEHYLEKQTYSSLKTYAIAHDGDLTRLIDGIKHVELNVKQKQILANIQLITPQNKEYEN